MKVLLVDDDAFLRDMYAEKFKSSGHIVSTATRGEEALSELRKGQFDVVLFDMVMPQMDGVAFLEHAKELEGLERTKFIVLSNQSEPKDHEKATAAGAHSYIVKAETVPSDVVATVEEMVTA